MGAARVIFPMPIGGIITLFLTALVVAMPAVHRLSGSLAAMLERR
jgi:hypothetical protein